MEKGKLMSIIALPDGFVLGADLAEILDKDEVYLACEDKFCLIPDEYEGRVVILFALPISRLDQKGIVEGNISKDDDVGRTLFNGRWHAYASIINRAQDHEDEVLVYHVKRDGKWFELGGVQTDRERFVAACVADFGSDEERAGELYDLCEELSPKLHRYNEHACNRELSKREEREVERLEKEITALAQQVGAEARFNSDPRGCPIKFKFPSDLRNGWGDEWGM